MSIKNEVEAVVINWKRPRNVDRIVSALRDQSVPCTITVCDCHPDPAFALYPETIASIDRRYTWAHNTGAFSRFVPSGAFDHRFTFFIDDDMLPGQQCIEHFLLAAEISPPFGALGQLGRVLTDDDVYRPVNVPRTTKTFSEVDVLIRSYFVKTELLHHIFALRWRMHYFDDDPHPEDDLLLCTAIQINAKRSCYLTPSCENPEMLVNKVELSNEYALFRRPDHLLRRTNFLRRAMGFGWLPLHRRRENRDEP